MKILAGVLAFAAAALILGCDTTDSKSGSHALTPGVYQAEMKDSKLNTLSLEETFGEDGSYKGRAYISNGSISCMVVEGIGKWKAHEKGFETLGIKARYRETCSDSLSAPEAMPDEVSELRNITSSGYEEYYEWESQPASWVHFNKI